MEFESVYMYEMDEIAAAEEAQDVSYDGDQFQHGCMCPKPYVR